MLSFPSAFVSVIDVTSGGRVRRFAGAGADGVAPDNAAASSLATNHASASAGNLHGLKALMTLALAVRYVTYGARAGRVDMDARHEGSAPAFGAAPARVATSVASRSARAIRKRTRRSRAIQMPGKVGLECGRCAPRSALEVPPGRP